MSADALHPTGRPLVNTFYFSMSPADFSESNAALVATRVRNAWQSGYVAIVALNNYAFSHCEIFSLDPTTEFAFDLAANGGLAKVGTVTDPGTTPQVAVLVHKQPTNAPRGFRPGRIYLAPPAESQVDESGTVLGAVVTQYDTHMQAVQSELTDAGPPASVHVVPSWAGLSSPPPVAPTSVLATDIVGVLAMTTDDLAATQRRRLRG